MNSLILHDYYGSVFQFPLEMLEHIEITPVSIVVVSTISLISVTIKRKQDKSSHIIHNITKIDFV